MSQKQDSCKDENAEKPSTASNQVITANAQSPSDQQTEPPKKPSDRAWHRYLELSFTGTVATFTIILAIVSYEQWKVMERQGETMERTLYVSERAYVGIQRITADLMNSRVQISFSNTGNLPADDIKFHILESRAINNAQKTTIASSTFDLDNGHDKIFKNADYLIIVPLSKFKFKEIKAISKREELLLIGGNVQYTDGFNKLQKTDFFFLFDPIPPNGQWVPGPVSSFAELKQRKPNEQSQTGSQPTPKRTPTPDVK